MSKEDHGAPHGFGMRFLKRLTGSGVSKENISISGLICGADAVSPLNLDGLLQIIKVTDNVKSCGNRLTAIDGDSMCSLFEWESIRVIKANNDQTLAGLKTVLIAKEDEAEVALKIKRTQLYFHSSRWSRSCGSKGPLFPRRHQMDPSEHLRAYAGDPNQNLQTDSFDSYNFLTGSGVLEGPLKEPSQLRAPPIPEEGGAQHSTGPLIGTLYTNHEHTPSSGSYPSRSSSVPKSNSWENIHGGLYTNSNIQNFLISGSGMMAGPTSSGTAQLLIGGLHGGSFNDGGQSDHGSLYYAPSDNQQESMAQLYYVNAAAAFSHPGYHSDSRQGVATLLYPPHDIGGASAQQSSSDQSQPQFGVSYLSSALAQSAMSQRALEAAGGHYNWRNGGNEHSFLPMNEESTQNHRSQFETDLPQYGMARACHADLSHMHQADHLQPEVGLHSSQGISVSGQGLSLSLSTHQPQFHSEHMNTVAAHEAAAMAKTKELASRYLAGGNADLSRFRAPSRDEAMGMAQGARYLQEHMDIGGSKHLASSSHSGRSSSVGFVTCNTHLSLTKFLGGAQALLTEVCKVTPFKQRPPNPVRSSDQHWSMAGGSSASVDGNMTYNGHDQDRSAMLNGEVDSIRDPASFVNTSPVLMHMTGSHVALESEIIQGLADSVRCDNRDGLDMKKHKLGMMLDEVEVRYNRYCEQLQLLNTGFDSQAGPKTSTPYTVLALQAMSRHFRCLRDAIGSQMRVIRRALGEDDRTGLGETSRLRYVDQQIRQQRALQQLGMLQQHAWRPQRGLPERAVSVLRAWLFEHFLHPYPKDVDKMSLAKQTGLTRSQVSNWFINARVRLWKPMVEEMYVEEQKVYAEDQAAERLAREQLEIENNAYEQYEGGRGHSGLLHEISASAQSSRMPNGMKRKEPDTDHDTGPSVTVAGGMCSDTSTERIRRGHQYLDHVGVAETYTQEGREAKKIRMSESDAFNSNSATALMHPHGMNVEGENCAIHFSTECEDLQCKSDVITEFGTQRPALMIQINQHENPHTRSQKGTATVDDQLEEPNDVPIGTYGAYEGNNMEHRYRNDDHTGYMSRSSLSSGPSTSTGVSLTLGLRHCNTNQLLDSNSMVSEPYLNNDQMANQPLERVEQLVEDENSKDDGIRNNGTVSSMAHMSNGHSALQENVEPNHSIQKSEPPAHEDELNFAAN